MYMYAYIHNVYLFCIYIFCLYVYKTLLQKLISITQSLKHGTILVAANYVAGIILYKYINQIKKNDFFFNAQKKENFFKLASI